MIDRLKALASRLGGETLKTGAAGEKAAERHLVSTRGVQVLARNWRHGKDELDLVCRDGDILVFVEVKTRGAGARVPGYFSVNKRKKKALMRAIRAYRARVSPKPKAVRFDIVEVEWAGGAPGKVRHFENVPLFSKGFARSP
ncbi:MAG: endonuclease [Verrucomicrobia bacterium]|nr:MAG: endonuclease [Verrucomicrobiota bacterium]